MDIQLDAKTKRKVTKLAKDNGTTIKKQIELAVKDAVSHVELPRNLAGFVREKR